MICGVLQRIRSPKKEFALKLTANHAAKQPNHTTSQKVIDSGIA
jgi:hypothetical protein